MNLEVTLTSTKFWTTAGLGSLTIKNVGSNAVKPVFTISAQNFSITDCYQMSFSSSGANIYTFGPPSWNTNFTIAPGASFNTGLQYTGESSDLKAQSLTNGVKLVNVSLPNLVQVFSLEVTLDCESSWIGGGKGSITIKNLGTEAKSWAFNLATNNFAISDIWNVTRIQSGTSSMQLSISGPQWKRDLLSGEVLVGGFVFVGPSLFSASTTTNGVKLIIKNSCGGGGGVVPVPVPVPVPVDPNPVPVPVDPVPTPVDPVPVPVPVPVDPVPVPPTIPTTRKKVFSYYTSWSIYQRQYDVSLIPVDKITHIMYAFMFPNPSVEDYNMLKANMSFPPKPYYPPPQLPEGSLSKHDEYADDLNIPKLRELRKNNPNIRVLISLGGWSLSFNFSTIFSSDILRMNLVKSSVKFVVDNGFDGLDIDFEFPAVKGASYNHVSPDDPQNFVKFIKDLRAEFARVSPNKTYEITAAIGCNPQVLDNCKIVMPLLDHVLLMTYDLGGPWDPFTSSNSALYYNPECKGNPEFNVDSAVKRTLSYGIPKEKINVGLPFYGRGFANTKPYDLSKPYYGTASGTPPSLSGEKGEDGLSNWNELRLNVNKNGFVRYYDSVSKTPFLYRQSDGQVWSYDDNESIAEKAKYVMNNGLEGILYWEASLDSKNDSLLDTVHSIFNSAISEV